MRAEDIIEALSGETRRRIVSMLTRKPLTLKEIADMLGITPPAALKHMRELESLGIVESYSINMGPGRPRKYYKISRPIRLVVTLTEDSLQIRALEIEPTSTSPSKDIRERFDEIRSRLESLSSLNSFSETVTRTSNLIQDIDTLLLELESVESHLLWMREEILQNLKRFSR
ncbi:MAG: helix-turn-helix domain-containing protein [Candidatus Korarchaeota archaeon]|nr:helix-turn-helix domain-containing protein [Candidatus Korarchaeota archaeon]